MRLAANNGGYIDFDYKLLPDAYPLTQEFGYPNQVMVLPPAE